MSRFQNHQMKDYKVRPFLCISVLWFFLLLSSPLLFAQQDEVVNTVAPEPTLQEDIVISLAPSAQLALSTPDYRVTPGDIYTLAYLAGSNAIEYSITVDTTYRIRVSTLGMVNAAGKTYNQLKTEVEAIILNNYPMSGVQFVLQQPGTFLVSLRGEVTSAREITAWALTRLSGVTQSLTAYASTRDITIRSTNGTVRSYDLFKARRYGDLTQNPYLRPGDIITFNRLERRVTISGAVERPGTYQMLKGENMKTLIESYGGGFTQMADRTRGSLTRYTGAVSISGDHLPLLQEELEGDYVLQHLDRIEVPDITNLRPAVTVWRRERRITIEGAVRRPGTYTLMPEEHLKELIMDYGDGFTPTANETRFELLRYVGGESVSGNLMYLSAEDLGNNYALEHLDTVRVTSNLSLRPVVFVEGAIFDETTTDLTATNRVALQYSQGETYTTLIREHRGWFTSISDTENTYIIRGGKHIPINTNRILYDAEYIDTTEIEESDTLLVPFRQLFVTVAGAVYSPGRYPYIPDRDWEYYVSLAGGFIPSQNAYESVRITDMSGGRHSKGDEVTPETIIHANTNNFLYSFNQVAPIITTILTVVSTFISVFLLITR
jgi:protein involved in polysaccharide export with SLBB domain